MTWSTKEMKKNGLKSLNNGFALAYLVVLMYTLAADIPTLLFQRDDFSISRLSLASTFIFILILFAAGTCILAPLSAGKNAFYLQLTKERAGFSNLWYFFTQGKHVYLNLVKAFLLRLCIIFSGCLLFVIPGIMQYYNTFFVSWILADNPQMPVTEVIKKSRAMTEGQRLNLFIMQVTFLGWFLITLFLSYRFQLLSVPFSRLVTVCLYALPMAYYHATVASLYHKLQGL